MKTTVEFQFIVCFFLPSVDDTAQLIFEQQKDQSCHQLKQFLSSKEFFRAASKQQQKRFQSFVMVKWYALEE